MNGYGAYRRPWTATTSRRRSSTTVRLEVGQDVLDVGRERVLPETVVYHRRECEPLVRDAEAVFDRYEGRPHWRKHHTKTAAEFAGLYPEFETFHEARADVDPDGLFLNDHLADAFGVT